MLLIYQLHVRMHLLHQHGFANAAAVAVDLLVPRAARQDGFCVLPVLWYCMLIFVLGPSQHCK